MKHFDYIISFDQSLNNTGWCDYFSGLGQTSPHFGLIEGDISQGEMARLDGILKAIDRLVSDRTKLLVVLEDFGFSRANQGHQMGGLGYLIRYLLYKKEIPYLIVGVSQNKKFTCDKGNANKAVMIKNVYKKYHIDVDDDNIADAVSLNFVGRAVTGLWEPTNKPQDRIVEDLRKKFASILE
jgi:hypothetical protein